MSKHPSYFDDDYDEYAKNSNKINSDKRFTLKSFLQLIALFIIMAYKVVRDFFVKVAQRYQDPEQNNSSRIEAQAMATASAQGDVQSQTASNPKYKPINYKRRRTLLLFCVTILFFIVMIGTFTLAVSNENNKISKFNTDAGQVCSDYVKKYGVTNYENLYSNYKIEGYRMIGLAYAREIDFNDDGESELLVCYNDANTYIVEVWAYVGKDFTKIYHGKACQTKNLSDDAWITIYHKNNNYYIGSHNSKDISKVSLMGMKHHEFVKKGDATYDAQGESFLIKNKIDYNSFERVKLSVLREEKAVVTFDLVSDVIDGFKLTEGKAKEDKEVKLTAKKAYADIINQSEMAYGAPKLKTEDGLSYIEGVSVARLIDFNNDGTDELLLCYEKEVRVCNVDSNGNKISATDNAYFTEIYTFKGGKAIRVYQKDSVSNKISNEDDYYLIIQNDGNKHFLCTNSFKTQEWGNVIVATSNILKFDGTSFKPSFKAKYISDYGYKSYYINSEQVWSKEFNEGGYVVPFFDGNSNYSATQFDILYVKRSSHNSSDVESQYEETQKVIQSLK